MLGTIPASAMLILFDFVIHNPTHAETDTNLRLLDTAAGYYGRLQYATGGSFPSMVMSGFAHIAADFVRRTRSENNVPASSEMNNPVEQFEADDRGAASVSIPIRPSVSSLPAPVDVDFDSLQTLGPSYIGMQPGISPEPLFYPIAEGDFMINDDLLGGFNFTNLFDPMVPDYQSQ